MRPDPPPAHRLAEEVTAVTTATLLALLVVLLVWRTYVWWLRVVQSGGTAQPGSTPVPAPRPSRPDWPAVPPPRPPVQTTPLPRRLLREQRPQVTGALTEDDVIAFGLALEAADDVLAELRRAPARDARGG